MKIKIRDSVPDENIPEWFTKGKVYDVQQPHDPSYPECIIDDQDGARLINAAPNVPCGHLEMANGWEWVEGNPYV